MKYEQALIIGKLATRGRGTLRPAGSQPQLGAPGPQGCLAHPGPLGGGHLGPSAAPDLRTEKFINSRCVIWADYPIERPSARQCNTVLAKRHLR